MLFSAGCAVNPVTGKQNFTLMSEAGEMHKGEQAAANVAATIGGQATGIFVQQLGGQLAQGAQSLLGQGDGCKPRGDALMQLSLAKRDLPDTPADLGRTLSPRTK